MKKILIIAAVAVLTLSASAQISAFKQGSSASVEGYSLPRTVITVKITQEREVILRGPYARYATQLLGIVAAPQSDKESYKIISAQIGFYEEPDPKQLFLFDDKNNTPVKVFNWLTLKEPKSETELENINTSVDFIVPFKDLAAGLNADGSRLTAAEKSQDQLAADAADVIYRLRKKRLELITGEIGEGVYGEGLKAALDEINRLEAEYTALFVGKRCKERITKYYNVVPEAGKNRITACRFSDVKGLVADTDMSGRPINIELAGENIANNIATPAAKKATRWVTYRIPQMNVAKLTDGQETLSTLRIPVYQSGITAEMPVVLGM